VELAAGGGRSSLGKVAGVTFSLARVVVGLGRTGNGGAAGQPRAAAWAPAALACGRRRRGLAGWCWCFGVQGDEAAL
jgi:hypothetical protein